MNGATTKRSTALGAAALLFAAVLAAIGSPAGIASASPGDPIAISGITPNAGTFGTIITITGSGFENEEVRIFLDGSSEVTLEVLDVRADQVQAQLVSEATPGSYSVKAVGAFSSAVSDSTFTVLPSTNPVAAAEEDPSKSGPRVVSAVATSNTDVLVQFSEPLLGGVESAENPSHYRIAAAPSQSSTATVVVASATLVAPTMSVVRLTTLSQSDILYALTVTSIFDEAGNPIPAPSILVEPSTTTFVGLPPSGVLVDSDGDGLSDSDEQRGWLVRIRLGDKVVESRHVTSDPGDPSLAVDDPVNVAARDTDDDGVTDNEEKHGAIDPRSPDTDGDILTDNQEWNIIYSDPTNQDADGDGTQDGFEFYSYRTSPTRADTDGDELSDTDEVIERNRDPRIADIPRSNITVGEVRLQIDERFTYEDATGKTVTMESSSSSSLTESESTTSTRGDEVVLGAVLKYEKEITPPTTAKITAGVQLNGSYTFSSSRESAIESQEVHERSLTKGEELSTTSAVTREIVDASINVDVTLHNEGDIAFAISNLEITVLQRDRQASGRLIPVATLLPNSTLITGEGAVFNLGPFTPERGPILFSSVDVFPNLVEQLMQAPGGLVFKVANFDMTDEFGRFSTFANQIARDSTAGLVIDYGDGRVDRHLVATALQPDPDGFGGPAGELVGGFNSDGSAVGIPLDFALRDILELPKTSANDCSWNPPDSTSIDGCDGIVAGLDSTADSEAVGDDVQLIPKGTTGVSVGSIVISAGQNGILDSKPGGDDQPEVITGYETGRSCSAEDKASQICETAADCTSGETCTGPEVLVRFGSLRTGDFNRQWMVLTNGDIPAGASFGQVILQPGMDIFLAFVQDLDDDGLFAREEFLVGSTDSAADVYLNDTFGRYFREFPGQAGFGDSAIGETVADSKDTDRDGLGDFAEVRVGWKVDSGAGQLRQVYSSPRLRDSDGDGLLDPVEKDLREYCFDRTATPYRLAKQSTPRAMPAVCAFDLEPPVAKNDAIAIIAGPNGIVDSVAAAGDFQELPPESTCRFLQANGICYWVEEVLAFGEPVVLEGDQEGIQTDLAGDDLYVSGSLTPPPASDPSLSDTDADGIEDFVELESYVVSYGLRDGGNGFSDTRADGDDVQKVFVGHPVRRTGIVILPGPNGRIDTVAKGDEQTPKLYQGSNSVFESVRAGDDELCFADQFYCAGLNQILESTPGGDDYPVPGPPDGRPVRTDPLRRDSDSDLVADGTELELGGNPADPSDGARFVDSDQDGLTDAEETELGWVIYVDGGAALLVHSNPSRSDSDFDGLPDFVERQILSNPNRADTDGDQLSDFDEFADFDEYEAFASRFPGFDLNGSTSKRYGTRPAYWDSDGDSLSDSSELLDGYQLLLTGGEIRQIYTNPLMRDTDLDGLWDLAEWGFTDAAGSDTDNDGTSDGDEVSRGTNPLVPDLRVEIKALRLSGKNTVSGDGANGLNEMTWWFTTQTSLDVLPQLLTSPDFATPNVFYPFEGVLVPARNHWSENDGRDQYVACHEYLMKPRAFYTLYHDHDPRLQPRPGVGSRSVTLREGEAFTLNGVIGEIDQVSADNCGKAPFYIPTFLLDNQGCVGVFNETFTYNDFVDGGAIGSAESALNSETCNFRFEYSLNVVKGGTGLPPPVANFAL